MMRPKILHIIGQLTRGGAEKQLVYLASSLHTQGWPQVVVTLNPGDVLENELLRAGVQVHGIRRKKNKLIRLMKLQEIVIGEQPSIIHSWSSFSNVYMRWIFTKNSYPRKIASFRGNPAIDANGNSLQHVPFSNIYKKVDCVISNSRAAVKAAQDVGVITQRIEIVGNMVFPHGRANPGALVPKPVIAAVGELIPLKAYEILMYALCEISKAGLIYQLMLAGDGPDRDYLENLTEKLDIANNVYFLGAIDNIPDMLQQAHIFVHTSRSEGMSNAILEAMGERLPVVATNVGGTPEIVEDKKTGLLVPINDPILLAMAIKRLLSDHELRAYLGSNGFSLVQNKYKRSKIITQYKDIYSSLVHSHL